jgi:hypothetical protein
MNNLRNDGPSDKGATDKGSADKGSADKGNAAKGRKQALAVLVLDTREEFLACIIQWETQAEKQTETIVFLTATTEPPLLPSMPAKVGSVYALLSFNLGTPMAPRLAYYVEALDVTELEWANDFPLRSGQGAQAVVEASLVALSELLKDAGVTARRGRWQLADVWTEV